MGMVMAAAMKLTRLWRACVLLLTISGGCVAAFVHAGDALVHTGEGANAVVSKMNDYERKWWKEGIVYQIYPRSFQDSNGDGIGDLNGVTQRLDYIKNLGVDIIWLCPHFDSPNADNGYDIRDYKKVMREFGTMEDFDRMLAEIKRRKMKLLIDLVVNHTSDEHQWFKQSLSSKHNPYRDYYIWRPAKNGAAPNNYPSFFGGSAWEKAGPDGEYYLHYFAKKQPDLNWDNPKLREEIYSMMRFWLDKGVDGFRMDVIPLISKDPAFPDLTNTQLKSPEYVYAAGPRTHDYIHEMNQKVLSQYDAMTVGEAIGIPPEQAPLLVDDRRGELNVIFQFDIARIGRSGWRLDPWQLTDWKAMWAKASGEPSKHLWNTVYLGNHDNPRMVSVFGNAAEQHRSASAKLLATLLLTQKGTPFLYQGDELGMTNYPFTAIEQFDDIEAKGKYQELVVNGQVPLEEYMAHLQRMSRDNARTPMQWSAAAQAGFTSGPKPWLALNPNYPKVNAAQQLADKNSVYAFYQHLIKLRQQNVALIYGDYQDLDPANNKVFAYSRTLGAELYTVLLNMSDNPVDYQLPIKQALGTLLVSNYPAQNEENALALKPWEARVYRHRR